MLRTLQYKLLKRIAPSEPTVDAEPSQQQSKLKALIESELLPDVSGKTVVDFGCGEGFECIELAERGADRVIGLDIRESILAVARRNAERAGVSRVCEFTTQLPSGADLILSVDAFEHFEDPAQTLELMAKMLSKDGDVIVSFGPPWYHPLGGHLFSVFPWAHLVFSEQALIQWRSDFKTDNATKFSEVAGGLNQITIRHFKQIVNASPFRFQSFQAVPIRKLERLHSGLTREFTTAVVRCRLKRKS